MRHDNKLSYDQHFWELPGTKIWFQNLLEMSRENMNVKEQNQTAAILAGLNKCKKNQNKLLVFEKLFGMITKLWFLQS